MKPKNNEQAKHNPQESLNKNLDALRKNLDGKWPAKNTAILVTHGIGNQKPIETLDVFTRGIICALENFNKIDFPNISVEHHLQKKSGNEMYYWFDNFIRLKNANSPNAYIDVYEYYWANFTEDKIDYKGIMKWLKNVVNGAQKHYKDNKALASNSSDRSFFIDKKGNLNYVRYFIVLRVLSYFGIILHLAMTWFTKALRYIPFFGNFIANGLESLKSEKLDDMVNVVGDIAVYNDPNPRSNNQEIRKEILNGCVNAIGFLLKPIKEDEIFKYRYDKIMIAAHSLGTQVSFDAINRITHQINLSQLEGYDNKGFRLHGNRENISTIMDSYITFGSPLDKVAFFFREESEEKEYVKRQVLENFHCFKQRQWDYSEAPKTIHVSLLKVFNDITWRNYHDNCDYVSGSLDYYLGLTNINCHFKKALFTHSNYWESKEFFADVLIVLI